MKAGSGESFLIGGFLAVALFFFLLSKIGVRVFARKLHAHEQNYRRKGKGELNREAEEGISVHATEWRRGKERDASDGRCCCCCCCCKGVPCRASMSRSTNAFSISTHPPTRPARGERASPAWPQATWAHLSARDRGAVGFRNQDATERRARSQQRLTWRIGEAAGPDVGEAIPVSVEMGGSARSRQAFETEKDVAGRE